MRDGSTPNKSIVPSRGLTWLSALVSTAPIEIVDYAVIALPFTQIGIGAAAALTAGQLHGSNVQGRLGHRSRYGCLLALAIRNRRQGRATRPLRHIPARRGRYPQNSIR